MNIQIHLKVIKSINVGPGHFFRLIQIRIRRKRENYSIFSLLERFQGSKNVFLGQDYYSLLSPQTNTHQFISRIHFLRTQNNKQKHVRIQYGMNKAWVYQKIEKTYDNRTFNHSQFTLQQQQQQQQYIQEWFRYKDVRHLLGLLSLAIIQTINTSFAKEWPKAESSFQTLEYNSNQLNNSKPKVHLV